MHFIPNAMLMSLIVTSAFAQPSAPPAPNVTPSHCGEVLKGIALLQPGKGFAVRGIPNGCIVSNSVYEAASLMNWKTDRIIVELDSLEQYISQPSDESTSLPRWGRIAIDGIRMSLNSGDKMSNYINTLQQWPMDFAASYRFNPESGYLHIQNVEISSSKMGGASISVEVNLPINPSIATITDKPTVTLSHLHFRLDNQGLWESMVLPTLANYAVVLSGAHEDDPEQGIVRLRDIASTAAKGLPQSQIDAGSKAAMLHFLQDMPHPTGFFTFDLHFEKPVSIEIDNFSPETLAQHLLADAKITVAYTAR